MDNFLPPQPEYSAVSRRPLDVEDYVDILRRNKGLLFGPAFLGLVIAFAYAFSLPDQYVSEAIIRIVPPQIPQTLVPATVNIGLAQRVNAMAQTVLSRAYLTSLVTSRNLYKQQLKSEPLEDIVEKMRAKIGIGSVQTISNATNGGDVAAFKVTFKYENRMMAQQVCADLVGKFTSENVSERTKQTTGTTTFLAEDQQVKKAKLDELEQKITQFRRTYAGALPEEMTINSSQLNTLNNQLDNLNQSISRVNQDKLVYESNLQTLRDQRNALTPPAPEEATSAAKNDRVAALDHDIETAELRISALKERYKDTHPDVQQAMSELAVLKRTRDAAMKAEPPKTTTVITPVSRALQQSYEREKKNLDAEIKRFEALVRTREMDAEQQRQEVARVQREIAAAQGRLGELPAALQEYAQLSRERDLAKHAYEEISGKVGQADLYNKVEKGQQGETLEVLDQASLPQTPSEPNRWYMIGTGLGVGLVIGIVLAAIAEVKNTTLKTLKDVRAYTQLNVLGSVPLLENELTTRRRRRFRFLAWSTAVMAGFFVMSGSVYYYYLTKS